jgi:hypothetical protein
MVGPDATREEQLAQYDKAIELANSMRTLLEDENFKKVFNEKFVKDYLLTQGYNLAVYDMESRKMVLEHILARSIFQRFIDEILEDGKLAVENKKELLAEDK